MHTLRIIQAIVVILMVVALPAALARAADGQVLITHAKVLAGKVTAGDAAGYPATLSVPGSYILGGNLAPGPNKDGIVAASADISIDLNGFRISGGPAGGTNNARHGIVGQGDRLTVSNGTIGGFEMAAIYAPLRAYLVVERMRLINNLYGIINGSGPFARFQNNTVASNQSTGVSCGAACHIEGNDLSGNGGTAIYILSGIILGNTIVSNREVAIATTYPEIQTAFGNNAIINNNNGGVQTEGALGKLHPNVCVPVAC